MSAALSRSQRSASSAPETMPTTLKSSSAGNDAWTCSASTPGSTARRALTGRLGIAFSLPQDRGRVGRVLLGLLASDDRLDDEPELGVVDGVRPVCDVFHVDAQDHLVRSAR